MERLPRSRSAASADLIEKTPSNDGVFFYALVHKGYHGYGIRQVIGVNYEQPEPPAVLADGQRRPSRQRSKTKAKSTVRFLAELLGAVLIALIVTAFLRICIVQIFQVPSGSMQQTLERQDRIAALRLGSVERGDIVVFKDPGATWMGSQEGTKNSFKKTLEKMWLLPDSTQGYLVKRVIGTSGDEVTCCNTDGKIEVNGQPIDEDYLYREGDRLVDPSITPFHVIVPKGHLFVLGDHRNNSGDSRLHLCETKPGYAPGAHAFIPEDDVVGPVVSTIFPFDRLRIFHQPETFKSVPDPLQEAPEEAVIDPISCYRR